MTEPRKAYRCRFVARFHGTSQWRRINREQNSSLT